MEQKVAIALRFLGSGNSYSCLRYCFRVAKNTTSLLVPETCEAVVEAFADEVFDFPETPEDDWDWNWNGGIESWERKTSSRSV